jgi:hypothetical protein
MYITRAIALLLAILSGMALAQNKISVVVDGQPVAFGDVGPTKIKGIVLVPMRGVFEKLGATLEYDVASQTITAVRGETKVELTIGKAFGRINDHDYPLDVPARIFKGTTLVPLRFMGKALGASVDWDGATGTVTITSGKDEGGG